MICEVRLELAPDRADMEVLRGGWEWSSREGCMSKFRSGAIPLCKGAEVGAEGTVVSGRGFEAADTRVVGGIVYWWWGSHE